MEHVDVAVIGGGQSGLATAHALLRRGLRPVVLEASDRAAGSWPRYYESLTLFSPARYSSLPGMPFPGPDRDRYPHRDEVVAYLTAYAGRLDAEIRTGFRVSAVRRDGGAFAVELEEAPGCPRGLSWRPPERSGARTGLHCRALRGSPVRCCTPPTTAARTRSPAAGWSWSGLATPRCRSPPSLPGSHASRSPPARR